MPKHEIPMRDRILDILLSCERQEWLSGEKLSAVLGISRAAVSKHIATLREEGNIIEALPRRGYRLIAQADPWAAAENMKSGLHTRILGQGRWIWLKETDSTNQVAALEAMEGAPEGLVVVARRQSEGRGSKGNAWLNLPGSLTFSVLVRRNWFANQLSEFTLLVQKACAAAVCTAEGPALECIPPNKLFLNGRKAGGILIESMFHNNVMQWAVLGVGLNVNSPREALPEELSQKAISLYMHTGRAFSITHILCGILEELERRLY